MTDDEIVAALDDIDELAMSDTVGAASLALDGLRFRVGRERVDRLQRARMQRMRKDATRELAEHTAAGLPLDNEAVPPALREKFRQAIRVGRVRRTDSRDTDQPDVRERLELIELTMPESTWWAVRCFHSQLISHTIVYSPEVQAVTRYELLQARLRSGQRLHDPDQT